VGDLNGSQLIAAERQRQIEIEGWSSRHDEAHARGEILCAAMCYLTASPVGWPWEVCWWKPSSDRIRNLAKAGALIAAEIDRISRIRTHNPAPTDDPRGWREVEE
jgi:hypothetical protein